MRRTRRTAALTGVAAVLLTLVPALPAQAQQPVATPGPVRDDPFPKPPAAGALPQNKTGPDKNYTPKKQCLQSNSGGGTVIPRPWGQMELQVESLWRFATGADIKVAVIDTGVNPHPRFGNRLQGGGDYVEGNRSGAYDCNGHGTLVAGIIAADRGNDLEGFKGVAPDAKILAIRQTDPYFADDATKSTAGNSLTLGQAIRRAADDDAVKVINISESICAPKGNLADQSGVRAAVQYAFKEKDKVIVVAAGNTDGSENATVCKENNEPGKARTVVSPAYMDDEVLTVGAIQRGGGRASFSIGGPWVDIAGPGTDIVSLDPGQGGTGLANRVPDSSGRPVVIQGTSFAAPYVAGVAALVRERFPKLSAKQVMDRLTKTAQHPAGGDGRDFYLGYGMVDPMAALTAVLPEEAGVQPAAPVRTAMPLNPPLVKDWTPTAVAVIGAGGGLGLLLITLFVVRTSQRDRRRAHADEALKPLV